MLELQPKSPLLKASLGLVSRRLDDMLFTPFRSHIINYEPLKGFIISIFTMYDESSDHFNHLMYFRQTITLDITNYLSLCKVFPTNLHGPVLPWFHHLPHNTINSFRDILEAFVAHYLCSAR